MSDFCPVTGTELEWAAARSRLETYIRGLHLTNPEDEERIIVAVLQRAGIQHAASPTESPTALALKEFRALSGQWFEKLLAPRERGGVSGFVSWLAMDAAEKWPAAFLAEPVPEEFQRSLQACEVHGAPDLRVSSMVPQPFENALQDITLAPLAELAKAKAPPLARAFAFVVSCFSVFWWGNRMR